MWLKKANIVPERPKGMPLPPIDSLWEVRKQQQQQQKSPTRKTPPTSPSLSNSSSSVYKSCENVDNSSNN
jgi:hypothetical protein